MSRWKRSDMEFEDERRLLPVWLPELVRVEALGEGFAVLLSNHFGITMSTALTDFREPVTPQT